MNLCVLGSKSSGEVNSVSRMGCGAQGGLDLLDLLNGFITRTWVMPPGYHREGWNLCKSFCCAKALLRNTQFQPFSINSRPPLTSVSCSRRSRGHSANLSFQSSLWQGVFNKNQALLLPGCCSLLSLLLLDPLLELL